MLRHWLLRVLLWLLLQLVHGDLCTLDVVNLRLVCRLLALQNTWVRTLAWQWVLSSYWDRFLLFYTRVDIRAIHFIVCLIDIERGCFDIVLCGCAFTRVKRTWPTSIVLSPQSTKWTSILSRLWLTLPILKLLFFCRLLTQILIQLLLVLQLVSTLCQPIWCLTIAFDLGLTLALSDWNLLRIRCWILCYCKCPSMQCQCLLPWTCRLRLMVLINVLL